MGLWGWFKLVDFDHPVDEKLQSTAELLIDIDGDQCVILGLGR